ncbi:transposase [Schaalia canis]|uniref:Transposase n=1 Tax=Schaalia canis TaxID=100469 RepID=A0A3P1SF40_9ACTO|nr:transposase [Schaalia canis]RRC95903.1 transposase [Schaalia canis]
MPKQFDVEFKQRAVRLVNDRLAADKTMSLTKAIGVIAKKLGVAYETVRRWYHDPALNQDHEDGPLAEEVKRLRRENAELRQVNELLKAASAFFASEPGPRARK